MIRDKSLFILACFLLGFASILSQIILFRELLAVFYGNELCLGILLCVWLLWVGLGSKLGDIISNSKNSLLKSLSFWYFLLAIFSMLTIIGIRYSRIILNTLPGEIIGFLPMLLFTFFILCPLCLVLGVLFVLNSKVWNFNSTQKFLVTRVYLWESLGAGTGGFLVSLILIPHLSNFFIQNWLFIVLILFSTLLLKDSIKRKLTFILILIGIFSFKIGRLDSYLNDKSLNRLWRDFPLVKSVDSVYGNLAVIKAGEQVSFYENGLLLFSYPDEYSSEEAVLYAMAEHPEPKKLLLIGGGVGGALTQVLKYKELKIDYVELDPEIVELGKSFLPVSEVNSIGDNRVKIIHKDGRLFVREKSGKTEEKYDLVILNLPDPYNAQLNRFYTEEFFDLIKKILTPEGILSFRITSAENYLNPEQALYISSFYRTLTPVFKSVIVLPGSNNIFLASDKQNLTDDWVKIVENLNSKDIVTTYLNEHFLGNRLSRERIEYLREVIGSHKGERNYDLKPISYFYNAVLWSTQLKSFEKPAFIFLSKVNPAWYFLSGFLISLSLLFIIFNTKYVFTSLSLYTMFLAGYTSIALELSVLLIYQVFYGYIYSKVGFFLTLYMAGLFSGAAFIARKKEEVSFRSLRWLQVLQVILVLFLLSLISSFFRSWLSPESIELILGGVIVFSGFIGGAEFTCANQLYIIKKGMKKVGTGYALDLYGAALSAILTSSVLIPLLGIPPNLWLLLLLNFVLLVFLYLSSLKKISV
jgi:spermidine synthase